MTSVGILALQNRTNLPLVGSKPCITDMYGKRSHDLNMIKTGALDLQL